MRAALSRRPAWVVVLAVLVFGGAGLALGVLRPAPYSAEAVVLVASGPQTVTPGSADQAARLAQTYAPLIARSQQLLMSVARQLDVPYPSIKDHTVAVGTFGGTSLLQVRFRGTSSEQAIRGAVAVGNTLAQGVPGIPAQAVTPVSFPRRASQSGTHYDAMTLMVVASGAGVTEAGNADQANKLAITLAGLIPADQTVVSLTARRLGISPGAVRNNLRITNDANTSILRIGFKAGSKAQALRGAKAVATAVTGPRPAAEAIPPRSLALVRLPTTTSTTYTTPAVTVLGCFLGLVAGLLALILWERADPRLGEAADAEEIGAMPTTDASRLTPGIASALAARWRSQAMRASRRTAPSDGGGGATTAGEGDVSVVIVPVTARDERAAEEIAARVMEHARRPATDAEGLAPEDELAGVTDGGSGVATQAATAPASLRDASRSLRVTAITRQDVDGDPGVVAEHDVIALVARRRTRWHRIAATVALLAEIDRAPDWLLIAPAGRRGVPGAPKSD